MQEPKEFLPGVELLQGEMGWRSSFWHCTGAKKQRSLQQSREEAFAKAEAFLCYTLNTPVDQNLTEYCMLWSKEMNVPAQAPCYEIVGHWGPRYLWWDKGRDFKSEQMVTCFKDIINRGSSGQMFSQRHWNTALQWQENTQKMCGC